MVMPVDLAIISALEREVRPLVRGWQKRELIAGEFSLPAFVSHNVLVVCGGIGAEFARRAAVAIFASEHPRVVVSAGLAGALDASLSVGQVFRPETVIDQGTGARFRASGGGGVLVSATSVLDRDAKRRMGPAYTAMAADMEAAAVALVAEQNGCPFIAVKAISDDADFNTPSFDRFIDRRGRIRTGRLLFASAFQPRQWPALVRLGLYSARASRELSRALAHLIEKEWPTAVPELSRPLMGN